MPQFRVEFVVDPSSGQYLAEVYNPENPAELLMRTEALYPSQAAAVLGLVNLFKNAVLKFPPPNSSPRSRPKVRRRPGDRRKKPSSAKARKPPKRRSAIDRRRDARTDAPSLDARIEPTIALCCATIRSDAIAAI